MSTLLSLRSDDCGYTKVAVPSFMTTTRITFPAGVGLGRLAFFDGSEKRKLQVRLQFSCVLDDARLPGLASSVL